MNQLGLVAPLLLSVCASAEYFQIGPLPGNAPQGFSQVFSKHVDVLGLHVYATSSTPNGTSKCITITASEALIIDNPVNVSPYCTVELISATQNM